MSVFDPPVSLHPDMSKEDLVAGIMQNFRNIPANFSSTTIIRTIERAGSQLSGEAQIVLVPDITGDGVTDDADALNALLFDIEDGLENYTDIVVQAPVTVVDPRIYINTVVNQKMNNVRLRFTNPVIFGPNGYIRQEGELRESGNAKLPSSGSITAGATSITLSTGSVAELGIQVGDQIVIRGNRNAYGATINVKETNYVTGIAGDVLTVAEPIDNNYAYSYTNSYGSGNEWNTVYTRIYPVVGSAMVTGASRGDDTIEILASNRFIVGDYVLINDATHTWDPDPGEIEPTNYVHKEIAIVSAIVDATHIRINHRLHHDYDTTKYAQVSVLDPIINSSIEGINATFTGGVASGLAKYTVYTYYAVSCSVRGIRMVGTGPQVASPWGNSWYKHAVRNALVYMCSVDNVTVEHPAVTDSGSGYGVTLYAATYCHVSNVWATGTRHAILLFNGSCGNIISGVHAQDTGYSDLDAHGAECVDNYFTDCFIVGGSTLPMDDWDIVTGPSFDPTPIKAVLRVGNPSHVPGDKYNWFNNIFISHYDGYAMEVIADSSDTYFSNIYVDGAERLIFVRPADGVAEDSSILYADNSRFKNIWARDITDTNGPLNIDGGTDEAIRGVWIDGLHLINQNYGFKASNMSKLTIKGTEYENPGFAASNYFAELNNVDTARLLRNDVIGLGRFISLTDSPNALVTQNIVADMQDPIFYKDNGGNTGSFIKNNAVSGYHPTYSTGGAGPTAAQTFALDVNEPMWEAADQGLIAQNFDVAAAASTAAALATAGTMYVMKVKLTRVQTITNIVMRVGTIGVTLTAGQCFAALYQGAAGSLLGTTADQAAAWVSTGLKTMAISGGPVTVQPGYVYVAVWFNGTTGPSFRRGTSDSVQVNAGLAAAASRWGTANTGRTTTGPATLGTISAFADALWVGLS